MFLQARMALLCHHHSIMLVNVKVGDARCSMAIGSYPSPMMITLVPHVCRWIPDELGVSSFAQLEDLKTIPVTSFDARFDVWHVEASSLQLSLLHRVAVLIASFTKAHMNLTWP